MAEELISTSKLAARNRANQILKAQEELELSEEEKKAVRAGAARAWYADLPGAATDITGMALDYGAEGLSRLLPSELAGYDLPKTLGIKRFQKAMRDPALGHKHLEKLGVDAGYIPPTTGTEEEERARLLAGFIDPVPLPVGSMKFTSPAVKAVKEIKQEKMPATQWISQMRGRGVKQDELYWTGVEDWLKSKKGSVTRQELDEYMEANQIQVQEVVYGEPSSKRTGIVLDQDFDEDNIYKILRGDDPDGSFAGTQGEIIFNEGKNTFEINVPELPRREFADLQSASDFVVQNTNFGISDTTNLTKFGEQVLPGGENYRELVLTLPTRKSVEFDPSKVKFQRFRKSETQADVRIEYDGNELGVFSDNPQRMDSGYYRTMTDEEIIDTAKKVHAQDIKNKELIKDPQTFTEGHFPEPNTIAWIRFNERVDADGKRVLFIEEIQSDWGHKGQAEGFKELLDSKSQKVTDLLREKDQIVDRAESGFRDGGTYMRIRSEDLERYNEIHRILDETPTEDFPGGVGMVPAGPFVMDTHQWTALTLKRMVRWASDNDFDSIAWTTGKQQADRYNLRKQVDGIEVVDLGAENVEILAKLKGEDVYTTLEAGVPREKLSDHIGKELADKALKELERQSIEEGVRVAQPSWKFPRTVENLSKQVAGVAQFEGIDLELGGDYVKFIYDDVLPAQAKKLGKKYGAKVGTTYVLKQRLRPVTDGQGSFKILDEGDDYFVDPSTNQVMSYPDKEEAIAAIKRNEKENQVWTMNLTDKLKKAAKDGLPYYVALPPIAAGVASQAEAEAADVKRPAVEVKTDRIMEEALP